MVRDLGGFQRVFARGGDSINGVMRAPVAIVNFEFFVQELLVESYNRSSEMFIEK